MIFHIDNRQKFVTCTTPSFFNCLSFQRKIKHKVVFKLFVLRFKQALWSLSIFCVRGVNWLSSLFSHVYFVFFLFLHSILFWWYAYVQKRLSQSSSAFNWEWVSSVIGWLANFQVDKNTGEIVISTFNLTNFCPTTTKELSVRQILTTLLPSPISNLTLINLSCLQCLCRYVFPWTLYFHLQLLLCKWYHP